MEPGEGSLRREFVESLLGYRRTGVFLHGWKIHSPTVPPEEPVREPSLSFPPQVRCAEGAHQGDPGQCMEAERGLQRPRVLGEGRQMTFASSLQKET